MTTTNGKGASAPLPLDKLWALRTDYRDVSVEDLGGTELRLYALTGTARAALLADMADLAGREDIEAERDPTVVRRILMFQTRVVAASLGYPDTEWDALGAVLGQGTIASLYEAAADLSGLGQEQQEKAVVRLRPRRKAASGTG